MEHAARVRAAVRRDREVDVRSEVNTAPISGPDEDVIKDFFFDQHDNGATEEQARECIGSISMVVSLRGNPWKFHYSITVDERGFTMDWSLHDDGDFPVQGKITATTLVEVAYLAGVTFGIFSYEGLVHD